VLSKMGWVRAAKGHDIDAEKLSYKAGDKFKSAVNGRSNQSAIFLDSTGRTYAIMPHTLPSARSQGEPITKNITPPPGATIEAVMAGKPETLYLLASSGGYGFVAKFEDLYTKNRNGKASLSVPKDTKALPPALVSDYKKDQVATVTQEGYLLVCPVKELPQLPKGKGNKIINIPKPKLTAHIESVIAITVIPKDGSLTLHSGKRHLTLKPADLKHYTFERGKRGRKLPRGYHKVDWIEPNS